MLTETKKVIELLQDNYNIKSDRISIYDTADEFDQVKIDSTVYTVYKNATDSEIENIASYIAADIKDEEVSECVTSTDVIQPIAESLEGVQVGGIYLYEPQGIDYNELEDATNFEQETKLFDIAKFHPLCKVEDKLIVSKEEDDGFLLVSFDLPENEELMQNMDVKDQTFVVFESDLKPVEEVVEELPTEEVITEEVKVEETIDVEDNPDALYVVKDYIVDGDEIYLVCYDKEIDEEYYKYLGMLTDKEGCLKTMNLVKRDTTLSITPELYEEILNFINNAPISGEERPVAESIEEENLATEIETSTNLLTALNSEKEAVITYEMLLKLATDEEEIELLTRILNDEKEHIALLSSLQTKQVADYVAEDNKETLDENAQDVIDTPAMTE